MTRPTQLNFKESSSYPPIDLTSPVIAQSGARVNVSGSVWQIGATETLNWDLLPFKAGTVFTASRRYFRVFITRANSVYVLNQYYLLMSFFKAAVEVQHRSDEADKHDMSLFEATRSLLKKTLSAVTVANTLDAYRRWYLWATDAAQEGFDDEFAVILENLVIGGNIKGAAVMSDDPHQGPLRPSELHMVYAWLRHATEEKLMPLSDLLVIWLFLAFGTNTKNLRLLNNEDLIKTYLSDGSLIYELRIPRIKKRNVQLRDGFRTRSLLPQIGELVEELILQNRTWEMGLTATGRKFEPALFSRFSPRKNILETDFAPEAFRWPSDNFSDVLKKFVQKFDIRSVIGEPLELTPRRLRYSFATRMVQEGATPYELADALDHTDLQQVMVYFNSRSDAVVAIDNALTPRLAWTAQSFMGLVVLDENDAVRGNDPASRIRFANEDNHKLESVGTCGSFKFCGLFAPIACYTCFKFQPWLDGPHEQVLINLESEREARIRRKADPRMVNINDATIDAVRRVIKVCNEWRDCSDKGAI